MTTNAAVDWPDDMQLRRSTVSRTSTPPGGTTSSNSPKALDSAPKLTPGDKDVKPTASGVDEAKKLVARAREAGAGLLALPEAALGGYLSSLNGDHDDEPPRGKWPVPPRGRGEAGREHCVGGRALALGDPVLDPLALEHPRRPGIHGVAVLLVRDAPGVHRDR